MQLGIHASVIQDGGQVEPCQSFFVGIPHDPENGKGGGCPKATVGFSTIYPVTVASSIRPAPFDLDSEAGASHCPNARSDVDISVLPEVGLPRYFHKHPTLLKAELRNG